MKTVTQAYDLPTSQAPPALQVARSHVGVEYSDGSSAEITHDTVIRMAGMDAVAVAIYSRGEFPQVLLRRCLRPAITVVRPRLDTPGPEFRSDCHNLEVVAGVIEEGDCAEPTLLHTIRGRASAEIKEEAGYVVKPGDIAYLGHGGFSSPGISPEMVWYTAADVTDLTSTGPGGGGSVLEVGATDVWMDLDDAIDACIDGRIEDMKSEVVLRRLRDQLQEEAQFNANGTKTGQRPRLTP